MSLNDGAPRIRLCSHCSARSACQGYHKIQNTCCAQNHLFTTEATCSRLSVVFHRGERQTAEPDSCRSYSREPCASARWQALHAACRASPSCISITSTHASMPSAESHLRRTARCSRIRLHWPATTARWQPRAIPPNGSWLQPFKFSETKIPPSPRSFLKLHFRGFFLDGRFNRTQRLPQRVFGIRHTVSSVTSS
jgi:hypothetical protein